MLTNLSKNLIVTSILMLVAFFAVAQNVRPYTQIFSQNIKGGTAIFGNTSMQIIDNSTANLEKMNETGNPLNTAGGTGFSNFGNDFENMQPVITDVQLPVLNVFNLGSNWAYKNPNSDQGTAWRTLVNPTTGWTTANGSFGFNAGEMHAVPIATTNYFLKTVNITSVGLYNSFNFNLTVDNGAVIYVNGVEVERINMPAGTITYNTLAPINDIYFNQTFTVPASYFVNGNNVIAVEVHQYDAPATDGLFDMSLTATPIYASNSSAADLLLPSGTNTIKFARLYWGGRITDSLVTNAPDTLRTIRIRKGTSGVYTTATAAATSVDQFALDLNSSAYQSYIDVTAFIQANGAGTYTVADIPCNSGTIAAGGNYAGWCIVIAYENTSMPYNSVRIYDGFSQVYVANTVVSQLVTLTGLNVPNNPLALGDAVMSTMVWEGDANLAASVANPLGDYVKINGNTVSNAVNPATNFWNGTVSKNGVFVHTKNPDFTNQMGIDIDEMEVGTGYGILPNATSVDVEFGTEADRYFPSIFAFSILMKSPALTLDKSVADSTADGFLQSSEALTYTLSGMNVGAGAAYNTVIVDSLPNNVTYIPNSLIIMNAPGIIAPVAQTDDGGDDFAFKSNVGSRNYVKFLLGIGATTTSGGTVDVGAAYSVKFKVRARAIPGSVNNTARITAASQAGDVFTDDGTAIIGPVGAPTAVSLLSFNGSLKNNITTLKWITETELDNAYFDLERSDDGTNFYWRGKIDGNGTTSITQHYSYDDKIDVATSIIYYRLRIVALDGQYSYSKIIAVRLRGVTTDNFSVYPNPFINNIKITINVPQNTTANCRIISFEGKEILNRKCTFDKGDNILILNDLGNLMAGSYLLEINTGKEKFIKKIIRK